MIAENITRPDVILEKKPPASLEKSPPPSAKTIGPKKPFQLAPINQNKVPPVRKNPSGMSNNRKEVKSRGISKDFSSESEEKTTDNSNMFLYIDLHGHASKKGVFMYGNHMANSAEAIECMLLPRLMSMNCHHFHFDACNFSERNMYHKLVGAFFYQQNPCAPFFLLSGGIVTKILFGFCFFTEGNVMGCPRRDLEGFQCTK